MKTAALALAAAVALMWSCRRKLPQVAETGKAVAAVPATPVMVQAPLPPQAPKRAGKRPARPPGFELIRPAPPGFKAQDGAPIALTLIPEREYVNRGRSFWYRLELQNLGRKDLLWQESDSFFEDGYLRDANVQFFVTQPDGRTVRMLPPHDDAGKGRGAAEPINVRLKPGETLVSRPWAYQGGNSGQVWGPFRELASRYDFTFLGRYKIKAVLKRPELGAVESNEVTFDVVP